MNGHQRKDWTIKQPRTAWVWGNKSIKNRYELRDDHAVIFLRRPRRKEPDLECLIDIEDLDVIADSNVRWCATSWQKTAKTYYVTGMFLPGHPFCGKSMLLHRFLTSAPEGAHVDHQDHNGLNNRRKNIPVTTRSENMLNRRVHKNSVSGIRGVRKTRQGSWTAAIKVNKKIHQLGVFDTAEEAQLAFNIALATRKFPPVIVRRPRGTGTLSFNRKTQWSFRVKRKGSIKSGSGFESREHAEIAIKEAFSV